MFNLVSFIFLMFLLVYIALRTHWN